MSILIAQNMAYVLEKGESLALKYSISDRTLTVMRYHSGEKVTNLCAELNISKSTLYNWIKQHGTTSVKTDGSSITARTVYLLEKRIKKLESELEIWKRCGCTLDSPLHEKLAAIENSFLSSASMRRVGCSEFFALHIIIILCAGQNRQ